MALTEADLHRRVCDHIRYHYPEVIFNSDGAGNNLSMAAAGRAKMLRSRKGFPDLQVAEARGGYFGLFVELNREGATVYLKNGTLSTNPHIQEQAKMLQDLLDRGYKAVFAVGFTEATWVIDQYMAKEVSRLRQPQAI